MAITVSHIIGRAGVILHDTTQVRWPDVELLGWLNDAQRELVLLRPDASVVSEPLALVQGTKQELPDLGIRIIDIIRNTNGGAVRVIDRNVLDAQQPDWHTTPESDKVEHYMFDLRDPKNFYVYPAQPAAPGQVDIVYSASPADAVQDGDITLDDIYANAILDYILYRAYSKDADFAGNAQRALKHHEAFVTSLGLKFQVDKLVDPNMQDAPVPAQP